MTLKKIFNNHIIMSGIYKGISGMSLFVTIRLLMEYLGQDNYGLWVLVFTLFQMVLLMDFGLQSSLKTKIPIILKENNLEKLKTYIKTNYILSGYLAAIIFVFFLFIIFSFNLTETFKINFQDEPFVKTIFILNIFFFCLGLIANLQKSLYVAFLKGKHTEESIAFNQIGLTVLVFISTLFFDKIDVKSKLILITFINGVFTLIVNLFYTIMFFKKEKLDLKVKSNLSLSYLKEIIKLGFKFLITQVGVMFIFSSDQYIVSNAFGPSDVAMYEIVNKYFQFPMLIFMAAFSPLWSLFANQFINKKFDEIKKSFNTFNKIFVLMILANGVFAFLCSWVIDLWIKDDLIISFDFILLIAIITSLRIFTVFYSYFLYGVNHLNFYIFVLLISVLIKIPLSYFFINYGCGINSVLYSSLFILCMWTIIFPLHSFQLIKNNLK
jgi:O-antigen/teichoic acid export membrane protein